MTGRSGRRAAVTLAAAFLARGLPLAAEDAGALLASGLEPPRAEAAARARLAEVERRPDPGSLADALDLLAGAIASNWSVAPDAREIGERALAARKAVATPDDPKLATSLSNLARICRKLDDAACERDLHERALAIRERSLGRDQSSTGPARAATARWRRCSSRASVTSTRTTAIARLRTNHRARTSCHRASPKRT